MTREELLLKAEANDPATKAICAVCGRGFLEAPRNDAFDPFTPKDRWARGEFRNTDPRDWPICGGKIVPTPAD